MRWRALVLLAGLVLLLGGEARALDPWAGCDFLTAGAGVTIVCPNTSTGGATITATGTGSVTGTQDRVVKFVTTTSMGDSHIVDSVATNGQILVGSTATGLFAATNVTGNSPITITEGGNTLAVNCAGCVTSAMTLDDHKLMLGDGGSRGAKTLGSLGTTTTVLHGNASGDPTFAAVANADLANSSLTINGTTNEISTTSASIALGGTATLSLSAVQRTRICTVIIGDPGAASAALANDNDSPVACSNDYGADWTITTVACWADAGSPTVTPILTGGSGTSILTGALTCGTAAWAAGTVNGSPVLHSFSGAGATCSSTPCTADVNITTAGGVAKYIVVKIVGTLP